MPEFPTDTTVKMRSGEQPAASCAWSYSGRTGKNTQPQTVLWSWSEMGRESETLEFLVADVGGRAPGDETHPTGCPLGGNGASSNPSAFLLQSVALQSHLQHLLPMTISPCLRSSPEFNAASSCLQPCPVAQEVLQVCSLGLFRCCIQGKGSSSEARWLY